MKFSVLLVFFLVSQIYPATCADDWESVRYCIGLSKPYALLIDIVTDLFDGFFTFNYNIEKKIKFILYTKKSRDDWTGVQLKLNDVQGLKNSKIDFNKSTAIITHGYLSSGNSSSCTLIRNALLETSNCNVILVDWWGMQSIQGVIPISYDKVVTQYVPEVANFVTLMLKFLENNGLKLQTTTMVGHSLGAHVVGLAGYQMKNKVNYIVGLDPALPWYEKTGPGKRLSSKDAKIVEVIHTNGGYCGIFDEIGHFDFYPNGGSKQPGCSNNRCSHSRAHKYYAESITTKDGFYGIKCSGIQEVKGGNCTGDTTLMGGTGKKYEIYKRSYFKAKALGGMYHLKTKSESPYAMGNKNIINKFS